MEQEEYTKEEIDWSYVEFVDNQDVLDLIEKVTSKSIAELVYEHFYRKIKYRLINSTWIMHMQKPGGIIALLDEAWYDMVFEPNKDFFLKKKLFPFEM
jgi:hypothetical protein